MSFDADRAVLAGRGPVCKAAEHSLKAIEQIVHDALASAHPGCRPRVEVQVEAEAPPAPDAAQASGPAAAGGQHPRQGSTDEDVSNHPLVREAMDLLEARVVRVEPRTDRGR